MDAAVANVKAVKDAEEPCAITAAVDTLMREVQAIGEALHKTAQEQSASTAEAPVEQGTTSEAAKNDGDTVDGDFKTAE